VVNDKLTAAYAAQPVVFIGYDNSTTAAANRKNRFYAAEPSPEALPFIMVNSGQQTSWGNIPDKETEYRRMIDSELGRPPQAALQATYTRVGNHFTFSVEVTNQSGVTLSKTSNQAMVHAIVYEVFTNATRPAGILTNQFERAYAYTSITQPLANGAKGSYGLTTPDLTGVLDWANLRMLVMVDYRPGGSSGKYDMLQAAYARSVSAYTITPGSLAFLVDQAKPANQTAQIKINSSLPALSWSASAGDSPGWITVSPATGGASTPVTVTITASQLNPGRQTRKVTIQILDGGGVIGIEEIPITVDLAVIRRLFLPAVRQ